MHSAGACGRATACGDKGRQHTFTHERAWRAFLARGAGIRMLSPCDVAATLIAHAFEYQGSLLYAERARLALKKSMTTASRLSSFGGPCFETGSAQQTVCAA